MNIFSSASARKVGGSEPVWSWRDCSKTGLIVSRIYRLAIDNWSEILLICVLATIAAFATYQGAQLIDPVAFTCEKESTWFHGDLTIVFRKMSNRSSVQYNDNIHPLFSLTTFPAVYILKAVFGTDAVTAVKIVLAAIAAVWAGILFTLLRLITGRRLDAGLFTILGLTSASAMFWLVVPETFPLGSVSIMLTLVIVAVTQRRVVSAGWYMGANVITLGFTVTNWMAGIIATRITNSWKRTLEICLTSLFAVVVMWDVKKYLFPNWPNGEFFFYLQPDRLNVVFAPESGGLLHVIKSFFLHTMIMPAF